MKNKGFTMLELVVVIVILGILSVVAAPRFLNIQTDAKIKQLEAVKVSVRTTNDFVYAKTQLPSFDAVKVNNRGRYNADFDGDGVYETKLKWNYLDNDYLDDMIDIPEELIVQEKNRNTFIGYDTRGNGNIKRGKCYFFYRQAMSENETPEYDIVTDDC